MFNAAITGLGLVTPAGIGADANWGRISAGGTAASRDAALEGLPVDFSCRVPDFDATALLGRASARRLDRFVQLAVVAARQAVRSAGLDPSTWNGARVGVVLGNSLGGPATTEEQHRAFLTGGPEDVSPLTVPKSMVNMVAGYVAIDCGATGPSLVTATACASGATAVGIARELLRSGSCDVVLAGGTESALTAATVTNLQRMGALTARVHEPEASSRPFDAARDGFTPAEGAGILVLEREEDARARGASVVACVSGYGAASDAFHATRPHPSGAGVERALRAALTDAGIEPADIGHVNAHGTSTPMNDATEALALTRVLGVGTPVTSTKGVTGHTLAAAGSIEAIYTALSLHHGVVPPTANLESLDPAVELDVVAGAPRPLRARAAASTSLGFGGHNAALVLTAV
ncbi:beta-ketoacyl-[acyl-carrier-protein] synthase family protein [Lentzea sp. NPDC058436]|uniref:beta-ketoacyl-[acyl-carrier-protein] synthase family protein n=1 Tax=Lentzea sp. NPDC058436 TaxID=3346499 RepID=UPI00366471D4